MLGLQYITGTGPRRLSLAPRCSAILSALTLASALALLFVAGEGRDLFVVGVTNRRTVRLWISQGGIDVAVTTLADRPQCFGPCRECATVASLRGLREDSFAGFHWGAYPIAPAYTSRGYITFCYLGRMVFAGASQRALMWIGVTWLAPSLLWVGARRRPGSSTTLQR
jgi:hypothetical protein